jgi:hypothetical protein
MCAVKRRQYIDGLFDILEMATTGSLKAMFESRTTTNNKTTVMSAPVLLTAPTLFKVNGEYVSCR